MIEPFSENYLKKLIGINDIEDALKRLDRLTQEEARMASAQVMYITNAVANRVEGIADNVLVVDDRMDVDDKVRAVEDKVALVIDGA